MPRFRIKQLHERVATKGLHMGGDDRRRKLEPGEVVEIPTDEVIVSNRYDKPLVLADMLWQTGLVDMVPESEPVTRPLDYQSHREAVLCSPTFKVETRGPDEIEEMHQARARVAARLAEQAVVVEEETPVEEAKPVEKPRRKRRGRMTVNNGQEATT